VHKNTCPLCKCDFSQFLSVEIEACLDHYILVVLDLYQSPKERDFLRTIFQMSV
jgi:hypothetical protein